jgi:Tfp pilus assembly protein PilO
VSEQQPKQFPWKPAGVAAGACLGLTVLAYLVGVQPLLETRRHAAEQQEQLEAREATAEQLTATLVDLQRDLGKAKLDLARTPLRLQPASLVNQRLEAVAQLAGECGVALDEMRPGTAVDSPHYQTVPIRIVGSGRYPACTKFLRKLRHAFGDMGMRTFNATNAAAAAAEPNAVFQAELVWFTELPRK